MRDFSTFVALVFSMTTVLGAQKGDDESPTVGNIGTPQQPPVTAEAVIARIDNMLNMLKDKTNEDARLRIASRLLYKLAHHVLTMGIKGEAKDVAEAKFKTFENMLREQKLRGNLIIKEAKSFKATLNKTKLGIFADIVKLAMEIVQTTNSKSERGVIFYCDKKRALLKMKAPNAVRQ